MWKNIVYFDLETPKLVHEHGRRHGSCITTTGSVKKLTVPVKWEVWTAR